MARRPAAHRRLTVGAVFVIAIAVAACDSHRIDVSASEQTSADSTRAALQQATEALSASARSPKAYRAFAVKMNQLKPQFDAELAAESERDLAFMALPPLKAAFSKSPAEQMKALALTVWPTALHVEPKSGETPRAYMLRICDSTLALDCKHIVPEQQPILVSARVWRRFKERAQAVYSDCKKCQNEPTYKRDLDDYEEYQTRIEARAAVIADGAKPSNWPQAGEEARPWSNPPLLAIAHDGTARFEGQRLKGTAWRRVIRARRGKHRVLGVYLHPDDHVAVLSGICHDAARAGYDEVALLARTKKYPYARREYRIAARRHRAAIHVEVRGSDTIQVLAEAIDATIEGKKGVDPKAAVVTL